MPSRIYLSAPHIGEIEHQMVADAFTSNWISPLGPHVDAFEAEVAKRQGLSHAVATSSGTAALHLALLCLGVGRGDRVWCSSLTFCGSVYPICYVGATPVFVDSDEASWNMDPELTATALDEAARKGTLPKVIITVDLYGQCCDYEPLMHACQRHGVKLIEDAAEALGATYRGQQAGSFGHCSILSFNGNKIITTSGGGMLLSNDKALCEQARFLATQARDPAPWYQHSSIGYNYRLSNICAGIGRGQLAVLDQRVAARRAIFSRYSDGLGDLAGLRFAPDLSHLPDTLHTRWLSVIQLDPTVSPVTPEQLRVALEQDNIESRPVWKPMHLQPVFADCSIIGGDVSARLFANGLCLPSSSSLTAEQQDRVIDRIRNQWSSVS